MQAKSGCNCLRDFMQEIWLPKIKSNKTLTIYGQRWKAFNGGYIFIYDFLKQVIWIVYLLKILGKDA